MILDIEALDVVPQTTTDELTDLGEIGLMRCELMTCYGSHTCWLTLVL